MVRAFGGRFMGGDVNASTGQVSVLSVVGAGRSGTTVLASILGEVPGCASAGEIRWLWERGVLEGRPCGCGEKPLLCPVWAPIVEHVLSTPGPDGTVPTVEAIVAAQQELDETRNRLRILRGGAAERDWPALSLIRHVTAMVVRDFAEATGADVVIDTSKRPLDAAVMAQVPDVDLYVVHMLRDPRAVAHSWRRAKAFSVGDQTRTMGTRKLPATVRRWLANALGTEALHRQVAPDHWQRLRYEDFCADAGRVHGPAAHDDGRLRPPAVRERQHGASPAQPHRRRQPEPLRGRLGADPGRRGVERPR